MNIVGLILPALITFVFTVLGCIMGYRMRARKVEPRRTFTLRVLDRRVPTTPIIYASSELLYDSARYGAAGDWFNLLTIPVNEDEVYVLEIKPNEQWKGWNA